MTVRELIEALSFYNDEGYDEHKVAACSAEDFLNTCYFDVRKIAFSVDEKCDMRIVLITED